MPSKNTGIVQELVNQWNRHDPVKAAALLADNVEYWDVTQADPFKKREEVENFFQQFFDAFPNLNFDVISLFGQGDYVACEWRMRGTQEKELQGISAIGKSIDINGVSICTVKDKTIVRQVDYWDGGTMMRQLGLSS